MKRWMIFSFMFLCAFAVVAINPALGQERNLDENKGVTAQIRAFDRAFFKGFDVYAAETDEYPTALLFDSKDEYSLPDRFWGRPLNEDEIVRAIRNLDTQHLDHSWDIPLWPRALPIVNTQGKVLGYAYTGLAWVVMDRKKDGRVTVFRPIARQFDGGDSAPPPLIQ
jgi:hypothetical protein